MAKRSAERDFRWHAVAMYLRSDAAARTQLLIRPSEPESWKVNLIWRRCRAAPNVINNNEIARECGA
jgi:hypothetical protein